jgi:hypothetical protein
MATEACVGDDANGIAGDAHVALPAVAEDVGAHQGEVEARIGRAVLVERAVGDGVKNMQIIKRPTAATAPGGQEHQQTALAFVAAIGDPSRIRRSRDIGAYFGLVPRRYQSGEVDYIGGISKCGDRRMRTLLYEAANVMLTHYKGQLKLKDWAFAIAKRSTMRKARVTLARRLAIVMHAMPRDGTEFEPV